MNTPDPIIEKIKKLLRMKHGGTPAEVETALALARDLAAKHNIDIAAVNPDEYSEHRRIRHDDTFHFGRMPLECQLIVQILQNFFSVSVIFRPLMTAAGQKRVGITFVGTTWDTQVAVYVFTFLVRHFRRAWSDHRGRLRNKQAFYTGMFYGLCAKLAESAQVDNAAAGLALFNQSAINRDRYIEQTWGKLDQREIKGKEKICAATREGYRRGLETEINRGLDGGQKQTPLLLS
jgi:hypothetical protein